MNNENHSPEIRSQRLVVVVAQRPLQRPAYNPQAAHDAEALDGVVVGAASDTVVIHHGQRPEPLWKIDLNT